MIKRIIFIILYLLIVCAGVYATHNSSEKRLTICLMQGDAIESKAFKHLGYTKSKLQIKTIDINDKSEHRNILITYDYLVNPDNKNFIKKSIEDGDNILIETERTAQDILNVLEIDTKDVVPGADYTSGDYAAGMFIFKYKGKYYGGHINMHGIAKYSEAYYQSLIQAFLYDKEFFIP